MKQSDLHDFVLVLEKTRLFVLTGQNTIAKQKKFYFDFAQNQNKTQNRAGQEAIRGVQEDHCVRRASNVKKL